MSLPLPQIETPLSTSLEASHISPPSYTYTPLDPKSSSIRLLALYPATNLSDIPEISIHVSSDGLSTYEALSYTWGSPEDAQQILVRDGTRVDRNATPSPLKLNFSVTRNLDEALRHLRLKHRVRWLWIDAICINQADDDEKSVQVSRMGDIYTYAERVIAWLGQEEKIDGESGTALAIETMRELSQKFTVDWRSGEMFPVTHADKSWTDRDVALPYGMNVIRGLALLLEKKWFERLWIWQEIRLGSDSSIIMCGNDTMLWSEFARAVYVIYAKWSLFPLEEEPTSFRANLKIIVKLCFYENTAFGNSLGKLLFDTQHCKYSDSKDRIFALLSLIHPIEKALGIVPDYTKTPEQIFKDVVLRKIKGNGDLSILVHCDLPRRAHKHTMPTWVPDWGSRRLGSKMATPFSSYQASGPTKVTQHRASEDQLVVTGLRIDIIKELSSVRETSKMQGGDLIIKLAPKDTLCATYAGGGSMLEAYCRTLYADWLADRFWPPAEHLFSIAILQKTIRIALEEGRAWEHPSALLAINQLYSTFQEQRFMSTEKDYIGLAPQGAKVGDHLVALLGFGPVMALRQSEYGQFNVVGACYLHGFMQSEAVFGPLDDGLAVVLRLDPKNNDYRRGVLDRKTDDIRDDDPRLGSLPAGWFQSSDGRQADIPMFTNVDTGVRTNRDPRLTEEALRKRGVDLETFVLV